MIFGPSDAEFHLESEDTKKCRNNVTLTEDLIGGGNFKNQFRKCSYSLFMCQDEDENEDENQSFGLFWNLCMTN